MIFDRYDAATQWPIIPQPPGDWKVLEQAEAKGLIGQAPINVSDFILCARALPLPFYRDLAGVEALFDLGQEKGRGLLSFVVGQELALLDGNAAIIHELNARVSFALRDSETAASYLRFFCYYVRGADGSFIVTDSADELPWKDGIAIDAAKRAAAAAIAPPTLEDTPAGKEGFLFASTVRYAGFLFGAHFLVSPSGMIDMLDDDPIDSGLPDGRPAFESQRFDGPMRLVD